MVALFSVFICVHVSSPKEVWILDLFFFFWFNVFIELFSVGSLKGTTEKLLLCCYAKSLAALFLWLTKLMILGTKEDEM